VVYRISVSVSPQLATVKAAERR
jgi:hypothetical protein